MTERPPLNAPITQQEGSHASRVMARWMDDTFKRLGNLGRTLRARVTVDAGTPTDRPDGRTFVDGGAPDSAISVFHRLDGGGPNA